MLFSELNDSKKPGVFKIIPEFFFKCVSAFRLKKLLMLSDLVLRLSLQPEKRLS